MTKSYSTYGCKKAKNCKNETVNHNNTASHVVMKYCKRQHLEPHARCTCQNDYDS